MKDNWLNKLIVAAVLFVAIIIIGLLTMRKPALKYELTEQQTLAAIASSDEQISPERAKQILNAKEPAFQFVDLRNPDEFIKGHPEGALNIPMSTLLDEENLEMIKQADKENKTLILYGKDQLQTTAPWLLLKQIGFGNVRVLQGGYASFAESNTAIDDSLSKQNFDSEAAHYNYADLVKSKVKTEQVLPAKRTPQKVTTVPKPKSTAPAAGGC